MGRKNNTSVRLLRDPFRPRRPTSSFLQYYVSNIDDMVGRNTEVNLLKHATLAQIAGQMWGKASPNDKQEAVKMADMSRKRYVEQMATYRPPSQEELRARLKDAPKRFRVNYAYFVQRNFAGMKKRHPEWKFGDVAVVLAHVWRQMGKKDKQPYDKLFQQDLERWRREMADFNSSFVSQA